MMWTQKQTGLSFSWLKTSMHPLKMMKDSSLATEKVETNKYIPTSFR